jgi:importin-7
MNGARIQTQVENHEGFCFSLLKIASQESVDHAYRQLAAIQLKNTVKRRWNLSQADAERKGITGIPASDKHEIMANLHECVVR